MAGCTARSAPRDRLRDAAAAACRGCAGSARHDRRAGPGERRPRRHRVADRHPARPHGVGRSLAARGALVGPGLGARGAPPAGGGCERMRVAARARCRGLVGRRALRLMGWNNPPIPWAELERTLSGRRPDDARDGGDGPAFSRKRGPYLPPTSLVRDPEALPYAELHAHSSFSFLDGASSPEELLEEAERLGLSALALVDHDTFAGLVRFAEAAESSSVATVFGAELSLGLSGPQNGEPDPEGEHLVVLARGAEGYHRLSHAMTEANLRGGEKGRPVYDLDELAALGGGQHLAVLTGCRKGAVRRALETGGADAAGRALDGLVGLFGPDAVHVELIDHGDPLDSDRNDALAALASARELPVLASGNVHYASPARRHLAAAVAAARARRSLAQP